MLRQRVEDRENLNERDANGRCPISHTKSHEPIHLIVQATNIHRTLQMQLLTRLDAGRLLEKSVGPLGH